MTTDPGVQSVVERLDDPDLDAMERECWEIIETIRCEFERAVKPYTDQIARIRNCRPPVIFMPGHPAILEALKPRSLK